MTSVATTVLALAGSCRYAALLVFGYFIPALSSVKAVVQKDADAYRQWTTYWLVLHVYQTVLSPLFRFAVHPALELALVLWLSLPRYRGASVAYDAIVTPWVDKYERRVDDGIDDATRKVRWWVLRKFAGVGWGAALHAYATLQGLASEGTAALLVVQGGASSATTTTEGSDDDGRDSPPRSPRHSVREALSERLSAAASAESFDGAAVDEEFANDFADMLRGGLYVFARVVKDDGGDSWGGSDDERAKDESSSSGGGSSFKLRVLSYEDGPMPGRCDDDGGGGRFVIASAKEAGGEVVASVPARRLAPPAAYGSQGMFLRQRCDGLSGRLTGEDDKEGDETPPWAVEIVLSDERDRDTLLGGLRACLPHLRSSRSGSPPSGGGEAKEEEANVDFL